MFSDEGGWNSLPFKKGKHPFSCEPAQEVHSSPYPSVCTFVHYPTLIFHLELHKEFSDGLDGSMGLKWGLRKGSKVGSKYVSWFDHKEGSNDLTQGLIPT